MDSVERYDTENQTWDTVAPIKIARSALSLTVLDGKLWAMGGFDGHSFLSIVELYDPALNKWEESTPLSSGRSGHASAVIYQPSCANQFMDCVDDQSHRGKRSSDDDDSKPGPSSGYGDGSTASKGSMPSTSSSSQLHAFSGNRCTHCDGENKTETDVEHKKHKKAERHGQNTCSKYEQQCYEAIHCLLRMNHDEEMRKVCQYQCDSMEIGSENIHETVVKKGTSSAANNDEIAKMDISDEETKDYDSFDKHDVKKYRRKTSLPCGGGGDSISETSDTSNSMCESSSSLDLSNSQNVVSGIRNRSKVRGSKVHQGGSPCSLSRLKNKVQQNICDFVNWSVSELPKVIPQDTHNTRLSNTQNASSNNNNNNSLS